MTAIPATVRYRNPGAAYPGPSSKPFGGTTHAIIGGGHKIAIFPTMTDGASSMMHLLWRVYTGMTFSAAIAKWSGGNNINSYLRVIEAKTRWTRHDYVTKQLLETPDMAIELCKAMAWHEAGREYPMTDAQWVEAHEQFITVINGGTVPVDRVKPFPVTAALELAKSHLGEREIAGSQHNPFIVDCFKEIGATPRNDETAWCAAFAGAMLKRSGMACLEGDAGLTARGYLNYGHAIDEPEEGCLVVFWRVKPNSWQGHVAFVESWTATTLTIVGGNQSNAVTRMTVARTGPKSQVLGYRRPVPAVRPANEIVREDSVGQKVVGGFGAIGAFLWSVWDGMTSAAQAAGEWIGLLPETAAKVGTTVSSAQQLTEAAGMPWPVQLGLFITLCSIGFGLYRSWQRLKANDGHLTRPPYETDEVPDESAEDAFDTVPEDLPPKRPRKAAKPAAKKAPARKSKTAKRRACA
jgi:uncharacterized protein (TIGR02594 family)